MHTYILPKEPPRPLAATWTKKCCIQPKICNKKLAAQLNHSMNCWVMAQANRSGSTAFPPARRHHRSPAPAPPAPAGRAESAPPSPPPAPAGSPVGKARPAGGGSPLGPSQMWAPACNFKEGDIAKLAETPWEAPPSTVPGVGSPLQDSSLLGGVFT